MTPPRPCTRHTFPFRLRPLARRLAIIILLPGVALPLRAREPDGSIVVASAASPSVPPADPRPFPALELGMHTSAVKLV